MTGRLPHDATQLDHRYPPGHCRQVPDFRGSARPTKGMLSDSFGPPQFAALLILVQRGLEELHSQRNTRRLLQQGAQEVGRDYYPVVAATHLAWIASLAFLVPPSATVYSVADDRVPGPAAGALLDHRHARAAIGPTASSPSPKRRS